MMIDFKKYIEEIIGRSIQWFDYKKLDKQQWIQYFGDVQFIVTNETFNNELHHYISDLVKFAALESQDFNQVLHTRSAIIALESFKQRLQEIENPKKEESITEPHSAI